MSDVVVIKLGGTSLATARRVDRAARRVRAHVRRHRRVAVVVSAAGHATDRILSDAERLCASPAQRACPPFDVSTARQREIDRALSAGVGWGYVEDSIADRPLLMLGGEMRLSRRVKLITENLYVPGETGLIASGGLRLFSGRLAADAGLVTLLGEGSNFWLPVVNFVYSFGATP